jgi:hypothetical protein
MTDEKARPEPLDPEIVDALARAWPGKIMQKQQTAQGAQICARPTGPDQRP